MGAITEQLRGMPREGNTYSKMVRMFASAGYNEGITISYAAVTRTAPDLAIRIHHDTFDLDGNDLIVPDFLLEHTRKMSINGGVDVDVTIRSPLEIGDTVVVAVSECQQMNYVLYRV